MYGVRTGPRDVRESLYTSKERRISIARWSYWSLPVETSAGTELCVVSHVLYLVTADLSVAETSIGMNIIHVCREVLEVRYINNSSGRSEHTFAVTSGGSRGGKSGHGPPSKLSMEFVAYIIGYNIISWRPYDP